MKKVLLTKDINDIKFVATHIEAIQEVSKLLEEAKNKGIKVISIDSQMRKIKNK